MDYKVRAAAVAKILSKIEEWNQEYRDAFLPEDQTEALAKVAEWSEQLVAITRKPHYEEPAGHAMDTMF